MIDVTDLPQLRVGDEIEVFGEHQLIETAAKQCGTISYELLCAVSTRVPRYYDLGGKCVEGNLQLLGKAPPPRAAHRIAWAGERRNSVRSV